MSFGQDQNEAIVKDRLLHYARKERKYQLGFHQYETELHNYLPSSLAEIMLSYITWTKAIVCAKCHYRFFTYVFVIERTEPCAKCGNQLIISNTRAENAIVLSGWLNFIYVRDPWTENEMEIYKPLEKNTLGHLLRSLYVILKEDDARKARKRKFIQDGDSISWVHDVIYKKIDFFLFPIFFSK